MALDMDKYADSFRAAVEESRQAAEAAKREAQRTGKRPPMVIWLDDCDLSDEELEEIVERELEKQRAEETQQ